MMPVIRTSHDYPPIPIRNFDWSARLDNDEPDDNGNWGGPYGHGATETEARDNLIAAIFEDMENDHLQALCEEMERRGALNVPGETDATRGFISGYRQALHLLRHLLDVEAAT